MHSTDERVGDDLILERMHAAEQGLLSQADALDMKASYLLIVLVFLAQLSTTFISRQDLSWLFRGSQWLSCCLLSLSAIYLFLELRIKRFADEDVLGFEAWRDRVVTANKENAAYKAIHPPSDYLRGRLIRGMIEGCKHRIDKSYEHNGKKVMHLRKAYGLMAAAFFLDIAFMILFFRLYSFL
jgi:hypothetical protein